MKLGKCIERKIENKNKGREVKVLKEQSVVRKDKKSIKRLTEEVERY